MFYAKCLLLCSPPPPLQGMIDVPIFGRISVLKLFRPQNSTKDLLFLLTERYKFCVLEYDESSGELLTRANGDVSDKVGRPCEAGQLGIIDPSCRLIGLHLYASYFKVSSMILSRCGMMCWPNKEGALMFTNTLPLCRLFLLGRMAP